MFEEIKTKLVKEKTNYMSPAEIRGRVYPEVLVTDQAPDGLKAAGKILKFTVEASDKKKAEKTVENVCQELRIFNPLVSNAVIEAKMD